MDQVTLLGPADANALRWHVAYNDRFNSLVERTFYLYSPIPEILIQIKEYEGRKDLIFIDETSLLDPAICPNKWIYQQLLKLSVDQLRDSHNLTELFLFTDVDTLPLRQIEESMFFREGLPMYFIRSNHSAPILSKEFVHPENPVTLNSSYTSWHYAMTYSTIELLGLSTPPVLGAIDACVIWSQKTLRRLKRHIEKLHNLPWVEAVLNKWMNFILQHQNHFKYSSGFRKIEFSPDPQKENIPNVFELQRDLRLGFSEWQLYSYFNACIDDNSQRWLGFLGQTQGPHVAEFNTDVQTEELLLSILQSNDPMPFLYFYPNLEKVIPHLEAHIG